ncbi:P-loop containing nucleoside triphosphate hydrolase superfamily protein [Zea mays]|uniref:p-loop containing nucleoside triphosphate hydrolase superfamily protein n=1 Tax=Zea mays TaxID=4577 RepID=A0A1D6NGB6_MAIZE|nr:P-loop containing nucleoside triphosphate hydrolase superfamily protein [Zea mays]
MPPSKPKRRRGGAASRGRKKQKRLDAIRDVPPPPPPPAPLAGGGGSDSEEESIRRSKRVRRAPVVLDTSPLPSPRGKRSRRGVRVGSSGSSRRGSRGRAPHEVDARGVEEGEYDEGSVVWRSRLRDRVKGKAKLGVRARSMWFEDEDYVAEGDGQGEEEEEEEEEDEDEEEDAGMVVVDVRERSEDDEVNKESGCLQLQGKELTDREINLTIDLNLDAHDARDGVDAIEKEEGGKGGNVGKEDVAAEQEQDDEGPTVGTRNDLEEGTGEEMVVEEGLQQEEIGGLESHVSRGNSSDELPCGESNEGVRASNSDRIEQLDMEQTAEESNLPVEQQTEPHLSSPSEQEEEVQQDGQSVHFPDAVLAKDGSKESMQNSWVLDENQGVKVVKEGRRCALCGGGTDGRPPKIALHDSVDSENEAYEGALPSEEPNYDMWDGFGDDPGWLGRLLGPIHDRFGIARVWVHQNCAVWSPEENEDKKMKADIRKVSHDAWRKDREAEEKWLENCGEDEEFLKREGKRLNRDLLRIAPVYIGGSSENEKSYRGWESVAGLSDVIQSMKEVVMLPLLYPEFFSSLGLTPPRGVLLHGHPGTGKTLVVRALIGACSQGNRRIAYFARKGADCLGKYVGDAERQLRLLFQVAERCQPSIIFFDEIDGLAPCRSRQQDQTHNSVVATLLSLLDGLKSRGSVVVIGATNRPDAIDPALRRPGRFDREIYFPLPTFEDRSAILSLHTKKWPSPISGAFLSFVASQTVGYAGADLQAICTQAAINALKRTCPLHQILQYAEKGVPHGRVPLPTVLVEDKDWLAALAAAPPPCSKREAGIASNDLVSTPLDSCFVPSLFKPLVHLLISMYLDERVWLPPSLLKACCSIKEVVFSSMEKNTVPHTLWPTYLSSLIQQKDIADRIGTILSSVALYLHN